MPQTRKTLRASWLGTLLSVATLFSLTASCSIQPVAGPVSVGTATATPFQPQDGSGNSPFSAPALLQPDTAATFTPVPTVMVGQNQLIPADVIAPTKDPTEAAPVITNPLTGLPFADPALAERRPMVIKVANSPDYIRPQSGLSLADVVYEYYIEWGDTRFIAVLYGNDAENVGPVRSGRYFDEHVQRMYHAFLVYKYSDPREKEYFYSSDFADYLVVPGFGACPPFEVGKYARDSYNNIFFNTFRFADCVARNDQVDNLRQDLRNGFFSDEPRPADQTAARVYTDYSIYNYHYWEYDPATHKYFRYQELQDVESEVDVKDQPRDYRMLTDALTGLPVTAENVVIIFAPHSFSNQFDAEDQVYHIDPVDSGRAYIFRDGLVYEAYWYRPDIDQPLLLADQAGIPIYLHPGQTFYEVIGESSTFIQEGQSWFFTFHMP